MTVENDGLAGDVRARGVDGSPGQARGPSTQRRRPLLCKNFTFFLDFLHEFQPKRVYNITGPTDKTAGRRYLWLIQHRESFRLNLHRL
jgi:hypothetical protein